MNWHMNAIILVARARDVVSETVRIWVRVAMLFLLQCKEVVCGDTLKRIWSTGNMQGLNDSSDGDLVLLSQR